MTQAARRPVVVVHSGTDTPPTECDGCETAARLTLQTLAEGRDPIDAAVEGVVSLEADGRFDAGLGSLMCMDGKTMEMCAAVMDSRGRLGSVAALQGTPHPVRVARRVADTPHVMLAGQGAIEFARRLGLYAPFEPTENARRKFREYVQKMLEAPRDSADPKARDTEGDPGRALVREFWNYPSSWEEAVNRAGHGTVGVVLYDGRDTFAVAASTAGSPPALLGRVADVPLIGCGFFAGANAAIACSGIGEHSVRNMLACTVYRWIEDGMALREALERGADLVPPGLEIGLIAVTRDDAQVVARKPMAHAILRG